LNTLSVPLGSRIGSSSCITIPALAQSAARAFCESTLLPKRISVDAVRIICDRAQGHPLYLRYLIDLANGGVDDEHLAALPLINGSIRNYYELLWPQLLRDPEAVSLLAIIARLRWGIPTQQLVDFLTEAERMVLVTTLPRIQHLMLRHNETTIYHSSFADFLIEKTALRELDVQLRLAHYCMTHSNTHYGKLNAIYHGLRSGATQEAHTIEICKQDWVDECVILGVEPDVLLGDVDEALAAATRQGSFTEVIRILLLAQRLQFRYDTLFAQSADLIADALISLGKIQEALQHAVRYGQLIVPVHVALRLAHQLNIANEATTALELLDKAEAVIEKQQASPTLTNEGFINLFELRVQLLLLKTRSGDEDASTELQDFYLSSIQTMKYGISDDADRQEILCEMTGYFQASLMCLNARYIPVSFIRKSFPVPQEIFADLLLQELVNYHFYCSHFGLTPVRRLLDQVFADLRILLGETNSEWSRPELGIIDAILLLGAPTDLVFFLAREEYKHLSSLQFIKSDNINIDEQQFNTGMAQWRLASLLDKDLPCPEAVDVNSSEWQQWIELICRTLAWCDGAARRAKEDDNNAALHSTWQILEQRVFEQLRFTLALRVKWENSYTIPEAIFPIIYERLVALLVDFFPERLDYMLSFIEEQFSAQYGLYNEGFRSVLSKVLESFSRLTLEPMVEDKAFALLMRWSSFVQANLKNRHELVPELLTIIPLFVRLNASEEAQRTYQAALAVSMGPSWYKEDQLGLMTEALGHVPREEQLESGMLSQIAALLEAASGEMTFQRFVRYDKRDLIRVLCKRGEYFNAVRYFIRQTCGTSEQLLAEASEGEIDRTSPLRGTRFPGGALDEQAVVYSILKSAIPTAHWPLCWALLEIYQFGDKRHLEESAELYILLLEKMAAEKDVQTMMIHRLNLIRESEFDEDQREQFLSYLRDKLPLDLLASFEELLGKSANNSEIIEISEEDLSLVALGVGGNETEEDQAKAKAARDAFIMPGLFGTSDSTRESEEALSRAERNLARGNTSAAQTEALATLESFQRGGWSIWGNLSSVATRAENILLQAGSADAVIKLYSKLVINEKYAEKWRRANHLIERVAKIASQDERAALVRLVVEHTEIMVGNTEVKTREYEFLEEKHAADASSSLIPLLLHAIDHPKWIRRDKAAEMVLWLLDNYPQYVPFFGPSAFTMSSDNHPDVLCGVLDQLSISNATRLWDRLEPRLNLEEIQRNCKHTGRLAVLLRIMDRAAQKGSTNAASALEHMLAAVPQSIEGNKESAATGVKCPEWAQIADRQWRKLDTMGLINLEFVERATKTIKDACAPLSVDTSLELEQLLAEGFREVSEHPLGRWMAKVRYAMQVALLPVATRALLPDFEQIFRSYNPARISHLRITNFASPSMDWMTTLSKPISRLELRSGNDIYLDFFERVWNGECYKIFRLTAFFYNVNALPTPPRNSARFLSTELPISKHATPSDSCARVEWRPAFFGSFTPATPLATLMQMTRATGADLTRAHWRIGRVSASRDAGFKHEGCYLAIKHTALRLPSDIKLAWVCEIDGIQRSIVSYHN
jgi:hypothetical protein